MKISKYNAAAYKQNQRQTSPNHLNTCRKKPVTQFNMKKLEIEGIYLSIKKALCDKPTANIILNGDKLKSFSQKSGMGQGCPFTLLLLNIVLEFLAKEVKQEKEIKGIQIEMEEIKLSPFMNDMILYLKDPKDSTKKLLYLILKLSSTARYKNQDTKSVPFLYTNNEQAEKEIRKTNHNSLNRKIPSVNLTNNVKDLCNESYKILKKEIEDNTRRWKDLPCSWIARIN
jgi:hypothetical protein